MADKAPICYVCQCRIDRSKEKPKYIYPIPREPTEVRAGGYACAQCAPEELRKQVSMGVVLPVGSAARLSLEASE